MGRRLFRKKRDGIEAGLWLMRYRDHSGRIVERSTGCRDRRNAEAKLRETEAREEKISCGIISPAEATAQDWQGVPLAEHLTGYLRYLESAKGCTANHVKERRRCLSRVFRECRWTRLQDLSRPGFEQWLRKLTDAGKSARTRNVYRSSIVAFSTWLVREMRAMSNPFTGVHVANEKADKRHVRRAFTEEELVRLIDAARRRPLDDRMARNRGAGHAHITERTREKAERLGHERALTYKTLFLTGLRVGELRRVRIADVVLDDQNPHIELRAADEKSRRGATLPLRADLAQEIGAYLTEGLNSAQRAAQEDGRPIPVRLDMRARLFPSIPDKMTRILDKDLQFAGIAKQDDRGRVLDVHSLRVSLATHLNRGGVAVRTAQAAMRHTTAQLTMGIYTDPQLLDVGAALDTLPGLPLSGEDEAVREVAEMGAEKCPPICPPLKRKIAQNGATLCSKGGKEGAISDGRGDSHKTPYLQGDSQSCKTMQEKENGGRCKTRTCDSLRVRQVL